MAKRSPKTEIRHKGHHSGCMQGLINIFDFRHGRASQKLLADKSHGNRRVTDPASTIRELDTLDSSCEMCRIAQDGDLCETATANRMSVKELMEEEMLKQDQATKMNNSDKCPEQSASHQNGKRRKNRWHTNKKSFDLSDVNMFSEKPTHRRHKSMSSLEVGEMMAELCTEINVKDVSCLNCDQTSEDKLAEATKVFVSHFVNEKNITRDSKFQPSGELIEALQTLKSNKDAFLKLLQDPNSQLAKHVQKLVDHHADQDDNSKVIGKEHGKTKHQSFFWRKFKGLERNLSKKREYPQNVSTIIVLKPRSAIGDVNKVPSERASTHFLFTEFTRKLKHAMRKEQLVPSNPDKAVGGEGLSMPSPTRDHFFIEKIPRKTKWDKAGMRKHLAEIVGTGDADVDLLSRKVPKPLGRILSWSDFNSSPICSPRKDEDHSLMSSPRNVIPCKESEIDNQSTDQQVKDDSNHHICVVNSELGSSANKIVDDIELKQSNIKDEYYPDENLEKPLHSAHNKIYLEGYMGTIKPTDAEMDSVNKSSEPCSPSTITNELIELAKETDTVKVKREVEDSDSITDRSDWSSPISVLEPMYKDDVSSSIKSMPGMFVAELIQPRKIIFEDQISPSTPCLKTREEERKSLFEFVKDMLRVSGLTEAQLHERFHLGEHLLDPSIFYEVDIPDCHFYDAMLVFDITEEVITEICGRVFDAISSFPQPYISLDLKRKEVIDEIWKRVSWHLQNETVQTTPEDHAIAIDLSDSSTWKYLRHDSKSIGIELGDEILEELIEDTILSCMMFDDVK